MQPLQSQLLDPTKLTNPVTLEDKANKHSEQQIGVLVKSNKESKVVPLSEIIDENAFIDPISRDVMINPTTLFSKQSTCGHVLDKSSLDQMIEKAKAVSMDLICPVCRATIHNYAPDYNLKHQIEVWRKLTGKKDDPVQEAALEKNCKRTRDNDRTVESAPLEIREPDISEHVSVRRRIDPLLPEVNRQCRPQMTHILNSPQYRCPVTGALLSDPVSLKPCEHNFDRTYIIQYYTIDNQVVPQNCPACQAPVQKIVMNKPLRDLVRQALPSTDQASFGRRSEELSNLEGNAEAKAFNGECRHTH